MRTTGSLVFALAFAFTLAACGSDKSISPPGAPSILGVWAGDTAGTAVVAFAPATGGEAAVSYTVTANPGGHTATGPTSPITVTGLTAGTAYTYSVVASNAAGASAAAATNSLQFYAVVETFTEPMTQPNDSIFTGTFTFDATAKKVTNLTGTLTQSMTMVGGVFGPPMTTVALTHQLSAEPATLGGVDGLLVTTFHLDTVNTFDPSGFAPGGTEYYGLSTGATNPKAGGVGNAYAMIFVNTADPTAALAGPQLAKLAYADCTAGGMMMSTCMTGTSMMGYGQMGTMMGEPTAQEITKQ